MFLGLIKEETPETITLEVNIIRADGSKHKMLFICDKDTIQTRSDKVAYVDGNIAPSNQRNTFLLKQSIA